MAPFISVKICHLLHFSNRKNTTKSAWQLKMNSLINKNNNNMIEKALSCTWILTNKS